MFQPAEAAARQLSLSLLAPDREGYGNTPADARPTLASRGEALQRLADALGLDRFAVFGVSGGCPYAVALASRLGPRVSALALVSPVGPLCEFAETVPVHFGHRRFFLDLPRAPRFMGVMARAATLVYGRFPHTSTRMLAWWLGGEDHRILARNEAHALLVSMTREALRQGPQGGLSDLEVFSRPWQIDFTTITAPSLVWQGTSDRIVPAAVSFELARRIPGCRVLPIEGAGHFWLLDHVADVLAEIKRVIDA